MYNQTRQKFLLILIIVKCNMKEVKRKHKEKLIHIDTKLSSIQVSCKYGLENLFIYISVHKLLEWWKKKKKYT